MKKFISIIALSLTVSAIFVACEKEADQDPVAKTQNQEQVDLLTDIGLYFSQESNKKNGSGNGNGSAFLVPSSTGANLGVFSNGEIALFGADYGPNDFWLQRPDGSVKLHLVSNTASGFLLSFATGDSYSGTGTCNFNYAGFLDTVAVPFPPFSLVRLSPVDSIQASSIHGQATVTLNGLPGPSKKLKMKILNNPGGGSNSFISLK